MQHNRFFRGMGAAFLFVLAVPATAQPSDPSQTLAESLSTLSREPKNLQALIAAGRASLELGDMQAAAGFFGRADEAYPQSPYPKIGMGAALTMNGDPRGAIAQFQRAEALGAPRSTFAIDRGLAYDLLGQQAQAQADYRTGMIGAQSDEARRRLALSQAISRDFKGAAATIEPLLQRRDQAAIRTNAFILALAGDKEGARRTIDAAMPGQGAQFEPFFRMLPVLRPEEKAAAVHLGEFPQDAAQRYAQAERVPISPVVSVSNSSPGRVDTQSRPGFRDSKTEREAKVKITPPKKAPSTRVAEAPRRAVREATIPNVYMAEVRSSLDPGRYASRSRPTKTQTPTKVEPEQAKRQPADTDSLSPLPQSDEPIVPVGPAAPLNQQGEPLLAANDATPSKVETIDLGSPPPAPTPKLEIKTPPAPRPKVELASRTVKPTAKPVETSIGTKGTYWVQLAGSGTRSMMASEYKKIRTRKPDLFSGRSGYVTVGKDYFRLVTGPFDSSSEAQSFVTKLDKAGIDSFTWTRNPPQIKIEKIPG